MNNMKRKPNGIRLFAACLVSLALAAGACAALAPAGETVAQPETASQTASNPAANPLPPVSDAVLQPEDFTYLGAFRLPGDEERPRTFAYGGNAMTFNPDGDTSAGADDFPGSLFVMGHNRIAYGDVPDGNQVAEISIPAPVISSDMEALSTAEFLQDFRDVFAGHFTDLEEIPRVGMAYLNNPQTGPQIHFSWGQHLEAGTHASHGWFNPDLKNPQLQGEWLLGERDPYSTTGYMFPLPADWADAHTGGRYLATGRMRDGGMGGMGPALFAYRSWLEDGSAPSDGYRLDEVPLLLYESAYNTMQIERAMNGYQHPDEWEGGAFLTSESGKSAVLFSGTKSTGEMYWYGYMHPDGPEYVCVDAEVDNIEDMCRFADGSFCGSEYLTGCCDEEAGTCASSRGWWTNRFDAQLILYDTAHLAAVAAGDLEPWQPQPYAVMDIDEYLFNTPPEWDRMDLGSGDQRRYRVGDAAFDRQNGLLYVLEMYADNAKPVVHVWRVY